MEDVLKYLNDTDYLTTNLYTVVTNAKNVYEHSKSFVASYLLKTVEIDQIVSLFGKFKDNTTVLKYLHSVFCLNSLYNCGQTLLYKIIKSKNYSNKLIELLSTEEFMNDFYTNENDKLDFVLCTVDDVESLKLIYKPSYCVNKQQDNILQFAIRYGATKCAQYLMRTQEDLINYVNPQVKLDVLDYAIYYKNLELVENLVYTYKFKVTKKHLDYSLDKSSPEINDFLTKTLSVSVTSEWFNTDFSTKTKVVEEQKPSKPDEEKYTTVKETTFVVTNGSGTVTVPESIATNTTPTFEKITLTKKEETVTQEEQKLKVTNNYSDMFMKSVLKKDVKVTEFILNQMKLTDIYEVIVERFGVEDYKYVYENATLKKWLFGEMNSIFFRKLFAKKVATEIMDYVMDQTNLYICYKWMVEHVNLQDYQHIDKNLFNKQDKYGKSLKEYAFEAKDINVLSFLLA